MKKEEARRQFAEIVARLESEVELDRAALLIAAEEYPQLVVEKYLAQLDDYAADLRGVASIKADPLLRLEAINDYLFVQLGFGGNTGAYYDARNSFLNEVMDRRTGIPITLSVLYLEIARRLGLPIYGVGMPGHFLVKFDNGEREIILDPFNDGHVMSFEQCREMFEGMYNHTIPFQKSFLNRVTKKQILARMLQNLKGIYSRVADHHKTLSIIERALLINPGEATEIRDRGLTYLAMGKYTQALGDLETYLKQRPRADDVEEIKKKIAELRRKQAWLN